MEIKKGMKFRCIKDVVMDSEEVDYCIGNIYTSEEDGCITDMQNDKKHKWEKSADEYFKKIEEDAMKYDLEKTVVLCATQEEYDAVIGRNTSKLHKWGNLNPCRKSKLDAYIGTEDSFLFNTSDTCCDKYLFLPFSQFERDFLNKEQPLSLKDKYVLCPTEEDAENVIKWLEKKGLNNCGATLKSWYNYGQSMYIYLDGGEYGDFKHLRGDITLLLPHQFEKMISGKEIQVEQPEQPEPSVKNDFKDGKLRWDLLPLELIEEVVKVYDAGAKKYGANRWQKLDDGYNRYKSALLRHLLASEKEDIDEDTGCYHIAQICWNALSMLHFKLKEKEE